MVECIKFLSGNEKIRLLRKQLRLTQGDFQNEHFTRGYLGLLENGRRNITVQASRYIASRLMEKAKEQGVNLTLDDDYFSRPIKRDAELYCEGELEKNLTIEEFDLIIKLCDEYDLPNIKASAYKRQGDIYYDSNDFKNAYNKYFYSFSLIKGGTINHEINYVLNRIGICKIKLLQYSEALIYLEKSLDGANLINDDEIILGAMYNCAICYKELSLIDKALTFVDKILSKYGEKYNINWYVYVLSLKANCYNEIGNLDNSKKIYLDLIQLLKDNPGVEGKDKRLGFIYNNLGYIEYKNKNLTDSLDYYNKSLEIRNKFDDINVSHTLIEKSEVYIEKKLYDEALMIINLSIEKANEYNDYKYVLNGYKKLEEVYSKMNNIVKVEETIIEIITLLENTKESKEEEKNKIECVNYYNKLQKMYMDNKKYEDAYKCTKNIEEVLQ